MNQMNMGILLLHTTHVRYPCSAVLSLPSKNSSVSTPTCRDALITSPVIGQGTVPIWRRLCPLHGYRRSHKMPGISLRSWSMEIQHLCSLTMNIIILLPCSDNSPCRSVTSKFPLVFSYTQCWKVQHFWPASESLLRKLISLPSLTEYFTNSPISSSSTVA